MKYEYFADSGYYDMWAVRPVGEKRWGRAYHVSSEAEAKALAEQLTELSDNLEKLREHIAELPNEIMADLETGSHHRNNEESRNFAERFRNLDRWSTRLHELAETHEKSEG